jgi:hypothetical protein
MDSANSCCGKNSAKREMCFAEKLLQSGSLRTRIVSKDAVDRGVDGAERRQGRSAVLGLHREARSVKNIRQSLSFVHSYRQQRRSRAAPRSVKNVLQFLGFANFYRRWLLGGGQAAARAY